MVVENLAKVEKKICAACERAGRKREEVTLIAVSKTKPVSMIEELLPGGTRDFGENKVQELCDKYEQLPKDIRWHLIGHLQRNKVKYVVDKACLIHSVDSLRLAEAISAEGQKKGITVPVLIEVNVAGEETKFGVKPEEAEGLIREIAKLPSISVRGLMTIAPYVENPEDNRVHFASLKKLCVDIKNKNIDNVSMDILSMGMTGDYEVAIEEGAKFLDVMKLGGDGYEDEYDDYDDFDDDYEDEKPRKKLFGRRGDDDNDEEEAPAKAKPQKVTPIRQASRKQGNGMEVCVIKPSSFDDAREVTETLLSNRTVVLNFEGLDVDVAQRIIDVTSGTCFAIGGNLKKVSASIFIVTPKNVDISGDLQDILSGAIDIPSVYSSKL